MAHKPRVIEDWTEAEPGDVYISPSGNGYKCLRSPKDLWDRFVPLDSDFIGAFWEPLDDFRLWAIKTRIEAEVS